VPTTNRDQCAAHTTTLKILGSAFSYARVSPKFRTMPCVRRERGKEGERKEKERKGREKRKEREREEACVGSMVRMP